MSYKEEIEKLAKRKSPFQKLKDNRVELTPDEKKIVREKKAVWGCSHGEDGNLAVWKSVDKDGKVTYITHTHRAYNTAPTLKGAISRFHNFIKKTSSEYQEDIEKAAAGLSEEEQSEFDNNRRVLRESWQDNVNPGRARTHQVLGVGGMLGGSRLIKDTYNNGGVDGRVKLYHNTNNENVTSMLDKGILTSKANADDVFTRKIMRGQGHTDLSPFDDKVYLAKKKRGADGVGTKRKQIENSSRFYTPSLQEASRIAKKETRTLKASIPYGDYQSMNKLRNPETMGAKNGADFTRQIEARTGKKAPLTEKINNRMVFKTLDKDTVVLGDNFDPKYLKGSKHYSKLSAKELRNYIKNNPSRFAKGVGVGALGAGMAAAGAGAYYKSIKDQREGSKLHLSDNKDLIDRQQALYNKMHGINQ